VLAVNLLFSIPAGAQEQPSKSKAAPSGKRVVMQRDETKPAGGVNTSETASAAGASAEDEMIIKDNIRRFSETYRFGPADALAIRVKGQPDYSMERVKVSPMGTIYHPLLGDLTVVGMTMEQLKKQLTTDLSEYILDPIVSLELLEVQSAKVGIIGEVKGPRVLVLTGPMTILDAITECGGFADTGNKSSVTLLRQNLDGSRGKLTVNVKHILEGKARPEENLALQAGDLVIVGGNFMKKVPTIAAISGFTSLLSLIQLGSRR
jgi:polysaccharide export outer membrane protein